MQPLKMAWMSSPCPFQVAALSISTETPLHWGLLVQCMQKGILVSCSAGNGGPGHYSVTNVAPWILTAGASTIDRTIRVKAKLGNGDKVDGESIFQSSGVFEIEIIVFGSGLSWFR